MLPEIEALISPRRQWAAGLLRDQPTGLKCLCGAEVVGHGHVSFYVVEGETERQGISETLDSYNCARCGLVYKFLPPKEAGADAHDNC